MPFILWLPILAWLSPSDPLILLLWLLAWSLTGMDWHSVSLADVCDSVGPYETTPEGSGSDQARVRQRLNEAAQGYYRSVYGARLSTALRRVCKAAAAGLLVLAVMMVWAILVDASEPNQVLLALASGLASILVLVFSWQRRRLEKSIGTHSRGELRRQMALLLVKAQGFSGLHEFMQKVHSVYKEPPRLTARFLVPYHRSTALYAFMVAISLAAFLFGLARSRWQGAAWTGILASPQHFILLALNIADIVVVVYFACLMLLNTFEWRATQLGSRYFPLQVLCHDLEFLGVQ